MFRSRRIFSAVLAVAVVGAATLMGDGRAGAVTYSSSSQSLNGGACTVTYLKTADDKGTHTFIHKIAIKNTTTHSLSFVECTLWVKGPGTLWAHNRSFDMAAGASSSITIDRTASNVVLAQYLEVTGRAVGPKLI